MMKTLILLFCMPLVCSAQNDTLNQMVKGKKDGIWKVYLDSSLNTVDNIDSAFFFAFEAYDNGNRIFKYYKHPDSKSDSVIYNLNWPEKGSPQLLTGEFNWFTNDGRILNQEKYKNGWPLFWKNYHYSDKHPKECTFNEVLDWSNMYNGIFGTYYYEEYHFGKLAIHGWFRKGKRGWRVYKEKK